MSKKPNGLLNMNFSLRMLLISLFSFALGSHFGFAAYKDNMYRNFWLPKYHGERLNYCSLDGKACGIKLAHRYCRLMGYEYADQAVIAHNVGLTNYLFCRARCKGWRCNGFKNIRCVAKVRHAPPKPYHYRYRRFVFPRFERYRVDWCYDGSRGCGRRAAFSFCRRMGYLNTRGYKIEKCIAATKAIGNQKLCFGVLCNAFEYIDCSR
ncbi:hypothetical protein [Legionella jordanis]|uniref:Uncharacterized protein n=1 Tax=Legionella jordanis TaxID=456 RepID=A0A0W0VFM2_9GAMM|nr:hypothetical protein [Legionella jordanis]KTD18890.1 hypothetical protein Ljor_0113 [Legionella jordanis]VEH12990.1 Uncharacterised protein [Legionella jordanis]